MVAIGLQKPYAKTEVGKSCAVGCLLTQDVDEIVTSLWDDILGMQTIIIH
jgi:hypothetical protein